MTTTPITTTPLTTSSTSLSSFTSGVSSISTTTLTSTIGIGNPNLSSTDNSSQTPASNNTLSNGSATQTTQNVSSGTGDGLAASSSAAGSGGTASRQGVSAGVTAGVAIATFVIGALLAAIIVFFVMKRRQRRHTPPAPIVASEPKALSSRATEYDLPPPKDDNTMRKAAESFFQQIDGHAETFYHDQAVDGVGAIFGRRTRFFTIKKLICEDMLAAIACNGDAGRSLLPANVTALCNNMDTNPKDSAGEAIWAQWRVSTCYLLSRGRGMNREQNSAVTASIVDRLDAKFQPFHKGGREGQRRDDLVAICKMAQDLGLLILSQPARWEFVWPDRSGGGVPDSSTATKTVTYFPAFVRKTDNTGQRLGAPRIVSAAAETK